MNHGLVTLKKKKMLEVEDFSERGDAPALAIIQDNARKKAVRQVVETQEELTRIHERVTRVCSCFYGPFFLFLSLLHYIFPYVSCVDVFCRP